MKTQEISTMVAVTLISGRLFCDMTDLYEALNFLTGEDIYTHQIPRAMDAVQPYLQDAFPELVGAESLFMDELAEFKTALFDKFGTTRTITQLPPGGYEAKNPYLEAHEMMMDAKSQS